MNHQASPDGDRFGNGRLAAPDKAIGRFTIVADTNPWLGFAVKFDQVHHIPVWDAGRARRRDERPIPEDACTAPDSLDTELMVTAGRARRGARGTLTHSSYSAPSGRPLPTSEAMTQRALPHRATIGASPIPRHPPRHGLTRRPRRFRRTGPGPWRASDAHGARRATRDCSGPERPARPGAAPRPSRRCAPTAAAL